MATEAKQVDMVFDGKTYSLSGDYSHIPQDNNRDNWTIVLDKQSGHILSKYLKYSTLFNDELLEILDHANRYFDEFVIPAQLVSQLEKYVNSLVQAPNTWTALTSRPDYNLIRYKRRNLPSFNIEQKLWKASNIRINDYPQEISQIDQPEKDLSPDTKIVKDTNSNYLGWQMLALDNYPDIDKLTKQIFTLGNLGFNKLALKMAMYLLLSPYNCSIIHSVDFWRWLKQKMTVSDLANEQDQIAKSLLQELVKYCLSYALYIFRHEETIMFSKVIRGHRTILSIDSTSEWPYFNVHPLRNPYVLQLTGNSPMMNCVPFYLHGERRICTKAEFLRRFNLATGGAFKGIDLKQLGAAVTGSILIPCAHVSPLESDFDQPFNYQRKIPCQCPQGVEYGPEDTAFMRYLNYYYPGYESLRDEDYIKEMKLQTIENDEFKYDDDVDPLEVDVRNTIKIKQIELVDQSKEKVTYNSLSDIDISITALKHEDFKEKALLLYKQIAENCKHRGPVYINEVKTIASIKYKLSGPGIPRPIDIFRIFYIPEVMIKKFHTHAVKMYYDGEIKMFRSCAAALLSGIGDDYHWFSCNKVAADVLAKTMMRGITVVLNQNEKAAFNIWLETEPRWAKLLKFHNIKTNEIYSAMNSKHPFFRPDISQSGIRKGLRHFHRSGEVHNIGIKIPTNKRANFNLQFRTNTAILPPDINAVSPCIDDIVDKHDNSWIEDEETPEIVVNTKVVTLMDKHREFEEIEENLEADDSGEPDEPDSYDEQEEEVPQITLPVIIRPGPKKKVAKRPRKKPARPSKVTAVQPAIPTKVYEEDEPLDERPKRRIPKPAAKISAEISEESEESEENSEEENSEEGNSEEDLEN